MKDKILNVIMGISILALIGAGYREYLIHNGKLTSDLNANGYSITNLPAGFFPAETDPTVPSWAKEDAPPSETDPTVPEWAKEPNKPTYGTNDIDGLSAALAEKRGMTDRSFVRQSQSWNFWPWQSLVPGEYKLEEQPSYLAIFYRADSSAEWGEVGYGSLSEDGKSYTPNTMAPDFMALMGVTITKDVHDVLALGSEVQDAVGGLESSLSNKYDKSGGMLYGPIKLYGGEADGSPLVTEITTNGVSWNVLRGTGFVLPGSSGSGPVWTSVFRKWEDFLTSESDPNVYPWAKAANKPSYTATEVGAYPNASGVALESNIVSIGDDATNYTDSVAQELATSISQKYAKASGDQLAQQVAAIGAHLNGEDARFVVTNYDSTVHTPEAYVEIKVSNDWLRVWDEGTRWKQYETWKTNIDAEISMKADRAWGIYDSETGGYSPDGFTQVSSSNILIAAGMAYQRTVTSAGAVWVLQCNSGVAQVSGDTNGFFRVMDSDGVTQFEIVKGDRREMGCDASGITLDHSTTPNNVIIPYSVVSEEHPTLYITERIETPNWKAETDADCIGTVTWTGTSGAYVATVHPKLAYPSMFIRATYMVGGETYIRNAAPVEMPMLYLNGTKYYLGTAVINGHTVLTLSTTAP